MKDTDDRKEPPDWLRDAPSDPQSEQAQRRIGRIYFEEAAMTADRTDAAARDVIIAAFRRCADDWCFDVRGYAHETESDAEVQEDYEWLIEQLTAKGLEIRERRSEPVVEISVEGATEACDCVRILWESRGQHSPAGMRTEKALQELQSALVRATGDGETT
jgi:hypothetical protein